MKASRPLALSACWILALSGAALGQPDAPLSGPPVIKERPLHLEDRFSEGRRDAMMADRGIRMPAYLGIINKLRAESAPEGLRLTDEQNAKITAIEQDFVKTTRAFAQRNRPANQPQRRPARPPAEGRPADAMTDQIGGQMEGQMEGQAAPPAQQRRERAEQAGRPPRPQDWQVKIWSVLSAPQQKFVDGQVQAYHAEAEKRRGEEYMRRQAAQRQAKPAAADAPPQPARPAAAPGPGPTPEVRERARRVFARLQQLPPEQRLRILERLEQELDRMDNAGPARRGQNRRDQERLDQDKSPPPMDDVNVPAPERPRR